MGKKVEVMTDGQVVRYSELTARRMEIVMHSGASWRPEYAQELEEIDKELTELRRHVDAATDVSEEVPADAPRWVKVSFYVDSEELHDIASVYDEWEELRCQVLDVQHLGLNFPELYHMLAITGLNTMKLEIANFEHILENAESPDDELLLDDLEHQQLKEETRQAYLNGGRTPYLYDIDGNEYYTTRDGVRHYTRVEG